MQDHVDRDVIASSSREGYFSLCIMTYRNGILLGKNLFVLEVFESIHEETINAVFQYYMDHSRPKEILVPGDELASSLSYLLDMKVIAPKRGI